MHGLPAEAFVSPDGETFRSAGGSVVDAAGGTIGVQAYVKASQGLLYPMPAGLCFLERVGGWVRVGACPPGVARGRPRGLRLRVSGCGRGCGLEWVWGCGADVLGRRAAAMRLPARNRTLH